MFIFNKKGDFVAVVFLMEHQTTQSQTETLPTMSTWESRFFRSAICGLKNVYNDYNVV